MRTLPAVALFTAAVALVACEKDGAIASKGSGPLRAEEKALLEALPGGNVGLMGGNYYRLQDFLQSSLASSMMSAVEQMSPGMRAWSTCFVQAGKGLQMLGSIAFEGGTLTMRYAMKGFSIEQIEACAKQASFAAERDGDGKFVSIETPTALGPHRTGYLLLPGGVLVTRVAMPLPTLGSGGGAVRPSTRADLEADVAAAARTNATADAELVAALARIDRKRAIWFVGDATATPAADQLGRLRGWLDLDDAGGFAMELAVQVRDRAVADQVAAGVPQLKRQAGSLGGEVGKVVGGLRFERKGDELRFGLKMTGAQVQAITAQLEPYFGAMGGGALGGTP